MLLAATGLDSFLLSMVVIVLLAGMWVVWWFLRKWFYSGAGGQIEQPWTLQQLRELREGGEISEEEFETLRRQLIAKYEDTSSKT